MHIQRQPVVSQHELYVCDIVIRGIHCSCFVYLCSSLFITCIINNLMSLTFNNDKRLNKLVHCQFFSLMFDEKDKRQLGLSKIMLNYIEKVIYWQVSLTSLYNIWKIALYLLIITTKTTYSIYVPTSHSLIFLSLCTFNKVYIYLIYYLQYLLKSYHFITS